MRISLLKRLLTLFLILFGAASCAQIPIADFEEFAPYRQRFSDSKKMRVPVILIPGIKGSILKKGDKEVWGRSYRVTLFHKFDDLKLDLAPQLQYNFKQYYYQTDISSGGIMKAYRIGFRKWTIFNIPIYDDIGELLREVGYDENTLFTFSYDWRLDNRISAVQLALMVKDVQEKYRTFLEDSLGKSFDAYWKQLENKNLVTSKGQVRVNIIAHSMGGLVSRYYLKILDGCDQTNKLIMLATPNLGSMDSLRALSEGEHPESVVRFYAKRKTRPVIFSWPSMFQLLPRYKGALCRVDCTSVPNEDWGLSGEDIDFNKVITKWAEYNLIPAEEPVAKRFLKFQLKDAYYFYRAINDQPEINYEENKLKQVIDFLDVRKQEIQFTYSPNCSPNRVIIFGGHCKPTLKYAFLNNKDNRNDLIFDSSNENDLQCSGRSRGDGRVPVESIVLSTKEVGGIFHFLMCEDHVGVVKNRTFQYNLLRELLLME